MPNFSAASLVDRRLLLMTRPSQRRACGSAGRRRGSSTAPLISNVIIRGDVAAFREVEVQSKLARIAQFFETHFAAVELCRGLPHASIEHLRAMHDKPLVWHVVPVLRA